MIWLSIDVQIFSYLCFPLPLIQLKTLFLHLIVLGGNKLLCAVSRHYIFLALVLGRWRLVSEIVLKMNLVRQWEKYGRRVWCVRKQCRFKHRSDFEVLCGWSWIFVFSATANARAEGCVRLLSWNAVSWLSCAPRGQSRQEWMRLRLEAPTPREPDMARVLL